jgi:hypothetical protein
MLPTRDYKEPVGQRSKSKRIGYKTKRMKKHRAKKKTSETKEKKKYRTRQDNELHDEEVLSTYAKSCSKETVDLGEAFFFFP